VLPNADVVDLAAYRAKGKTAGQAPDSDGAPGEIRTRAPASGGRILKAGKSPKCALTRNSTVGQRWQTVAVCGPFVYPVCTNK
jgi:hypothetical protein